MVDRSGSALGARSRQRLVFVHSEGRHRYFGRSRADRTREVTIADVAALTSAGFDIVEVNMHEGRPLCADLAPLFRWG
jgi:hypothetical protein